MARLIDADALISQIKLAASRTSLGETKPNEISGVEVICLINDAPTVNAAQVVYATRGLHIGDRHYCSACHKLAHCESYCSKCGAKIIDIEGDEMRV